MDVLGSQMFCSVAQRPFVAFCGQNHNKKNTNNEVHELQSMHTHLLQKQWRPEKPAQSDSLNASTRGPRLCTAALRL